MIVILEGLNGTGKTTTAKSLAKDHGFRIYRPLREDYDAHWRETGKLKLELRRCRMPSNTYLDDVFAADALAQLRPPKVVLDRSMPSALAYGEQKGEIRGEPHREALEQYWLRRLNGLGSVYYFWLVADHAIARKRSDDEFYPPMDRLGAMEKSFSRSFEAARKAGLIARQINTTKKPPLEQIYNEIGETT